MNMRQRHQGMVGLRSNVNNDRMCLKSFKVRFERDDEHYQGTHQTLA